jgi:hypothetical protein
LTSLTPTPSLDGRGKLILAPRHPTHSAKEPMMLYTLISGDNHLDLTYFPPDFWSSQAPAKWKLLVPRVEELENGLHWFVEGYEKGMWNGIGSGFMKYQEEMFSHID